MEEEWEEEWQKQEKWERNGGVNEVGWGTLGLHLRIIHPFPC